ncbi:Outer membrane protein Slp [Vibrio stylophorae]|uniref:Outer membrane protein Slp n=1 Tax=Vibrio stylophorae TaxID=659351 RepID=A0ABM8ZSJ1_9VIBR|nr:Slp family lipoprotein [Vibrio stylophorae]CAH0533284.1 Outer membrane protein Slp [Vibrio stylophorae]
MKQFYLAALLTLTLSACSTTPQSLQSSAENLITQYAELNQAQIKQPVRLGGVIAKVDNLAERTRVEIVSLPLSSSGRPDINANTQGRFVAYIDGFVEPVAFHPGRLISVLGQYSGQEQGKIGEYNYTFPVLMVSGTQLWNVSQEVIIYDDFGRFDCFDPFYCDPFDNGIRRGKVQDRVVPQSE